jgi:hypothetical protein
MRAISRADFPPQFIEQRCQRLRPLDCDLLCLAAIGPRPPWPSANAADRGARAVKRWRGQGDAAHKFTKDTALLT